MTTKPPIHNAKSGYLTGHSVNDTPTNGIDSKSSRIYVKRPHTTNGPTSQLKTCSSQFNKSPKSNQTSSISERINGYQSYDSNWTISSPIAMLHVPSNDYDRSKQITNGSHKVVYSYIHFL